MNRKIKFRGKRIDTQEWVIGYLIGRDVIVGEIIEFNEDYFNTAFWYKVTPETIGQFTGMYDKNGVKIFEGDIITSDNNPCETVTWNTFDNEQGFTIDTDDLSIEIIGNITDNPELLKT